MTVDSLRVETAATETGAEYSMLCAVIFSIGNCNACADLNMRFGEPKIYLLEFVYRLFAP